MADIQEPYHAKRHGRLMTEDEKRAVGRIVLARAFCERHGILWERAITDAAYLWYETKDEILERYDGSAID